jgi:hypothetical protein
VAQLDKLRSQITNLRYHANLGALGRRKNQTFEWHARQLFAKEIPGWAAWAA